MRQTFFISDLHLSAHTTRLNQLFFKFIADIAPRAENLYILGDFFELWVGDDLENAFTLSIQTALKNLASQGCKIYLMPGNRDFLLGKKFTAQCHAQLLTDPTLIDLYGVPTLLMHGDSLCTDDVKHQQFRRLTQNHFLRQFFLLLPRAWRLKIGNYIRQKSERGQANAMVLIDVNEQTVHEEMQKAHVTHLIHGHTHTAKIVDFTVGNAHYQRFVLGAWHDDQGNYLACEAQQSPRLEFFTL